LIEDTIPVTTVKADELRAHIGTKNVVVKMDIESGEHLFMKTGEKLFRELNIMALQMEFWRKKLSNGPQLSKHYEFVTHFMTSRNFSLLSMSFQVQNIATFNEWDGLWVRNDFVAQVARNG
ncbi:hypothetical protein BOX15_Mlig033448g1, partial [Macrostomum lignano]